MRHQHRDLAILDFPAAYGQVIPVSSDAKLAEINAWRNARALSEVTRFQIWLQMAHRFLALMIAAGVIVCLFRARAAELRGTPLARFADAWFLLLACQITSGRLGHLEQQGCRHCDGSCRGRRDDACRGRHHFRNLPAAFTTTRRRPRRRRRYLVSEKLHAS